MSSEFYRPMYETDASYYDDVYDRAARDVIPGMWESSDLMGGETDDRDAGTCSCAVILPAGGTVKPCVLHGGMT